MNVGYGFFLVYSIYLFIESIYFVHILMFDLSLVNILIDFKMITIQLLKSVLLNRNEIDELSEDEM